MNRKVLFMKTEEDYIQDISQIRSMMERSTRFLSLTGWSGILAGVYALAGAYWAYRTYYVAGESLLYNTLDTPQLYAPAQPFFLLATSILVLAVGTAVLLSWKRARTKGEQLWNPAARRLVINLAIPLVTGGVFVLLLFAKGLVGLIAPATLIFYGLALVNAGKFTFEEVKYFGIIEILLGLLAMYFIGYGLLFWAIGFGLLHIVYGVYMHIKYER